MNKSLLFTISGLLITTIVSLAQPPVPPPPPEDAPPPMRERFQEMQMWKLIEVLDLSEEQSAKFFPMFHDFQKKVDAIRKENDELFKKLDGYIAAEEKDKIEPLITQIEANESKILETRTAFRKEVANAKVLDKIQIGKLIAFQREFPRRFWDAMWDCRMGAPGRPGKHKNWPESPSDYNDTQKRMQIQNPGEGPNCPH
jgi:Spy/CpxP family protein refolding chaperone